MSINKFNKCEGFDEHKPLAIELLSILTKLLDKYSIDYFLISGTLLGYYRHNDFIPWDDDIDIIANEDFLSKLEQIQNDDIIKNNYICVSMKKNHMYKFFFPNKVIKHSKGFENDFYWPFIDIFIYSQNQQHLNFFNKDWEINEFYPSEKKLFNDILVSVPKNPLYFLQKNYGDNFMDVYESSRYCHKKECRNRIIQKINVNEYKNNDI